MSLIGLLTATEKQVHLRPVTHETYTMAFEEQLEGTGITRKGDPHPQVSTPTSEMVAGGRQCASRSTITPTETFSENLYGRIKRRVGRSLKRAHCKGRLVLSRSKLHINYLELKAVYLALKEFQDFCLNNKVLIDTYNTKWLPT